MALIPHPNHRKFVRGILTKQYIIDTDYRCPDVRHCRFCKAYAEGLMKIGKRAYAHPECFYARYPTHQEER